MGTVYTNNQVFGPGIVTTDGMQVRLMNLEYPPIPLPVPCEEWTEAIIAGGGALPSTFPILFPAEWAVIAATGGSPALVAPGVMLFENTPSGASRRRANTGDCGSLTALDATLASRAIEMTVNTLTSVAQAGVRSIQVLTWPAWTVIISPTGDGYQFRTNCVKPDGGTTINVGEADGFGNFAYEIHRFVNGVGTRVATGNSVGTVAPGQKIRSQIRWNAGFTQCEVTGFAKNIQVVQFTDNAPRGIGGVMAVGRGNTVNGGPTPGPTLRDLDVFLIDPLP